MRKKRQNAKWTEQIKKEEEAIFQETVKQAQREAEAESDSQYGFASDGSGLW